MKSTRLLMVVFLVLLAADPAAAIVPESGYWWDPGRPGEGALLEVQGDRAGLVLFSYGPDGRPVFYIAAGLMEETFSGEQRAEGFYPMDYLQADLFATSDGFVFNSLERLYEPEEADPFRADKVGRTFVQFAYGDLLIVSVLLDPTPDGMARSSTLYLRRFDFGYGAFGRNGISPRRSCWSDLRGEWVFIDQTDPAAAPWRFDFSEIELPEDPALLDCPPSEDEPPKILIYRDPERGATLRCVDSGFGTDPFDGRSKHACELRQDDTQEPLFWFHPTDQGLKRISASLGGQPNRLVQRTEQRVIGIRVE